jgi:type I restriction enzyme S subunit
LDDLPDGTSFTRIFEAGQVLFGKRRAYQRKVAVPDFAGICSSDILVFDVANGDLLRGFLPYVVQSDAFFQHALGTSAGSLSPRTKWQELAKYEFALPPLLEQQRIADLLGCVDDAVESYDAAIRSSAVLLEAERSSLVDLAGTSAVPLGDVADAVYGLTLNAGRKDLELALPYLRVANIQRGALNLSEVKHVGVTSIEAEKFALNPRDILVVEGHADPTQVGRSALWIPSRGGGVMLHQNHVMRIRTGTQVVPEFLLAWIHRLTTTKRHAYPPKRPPELGE